MLFNRPGTFDIMVARDGFFQLEKTRTKVKLFQTQWHLGWNGLPLILVLNFAFFAIVKKSRNLKACEWKSSWNKLILVENSVITTATWRSIRRFAMIRWCLEMLRRTTHLLVLVYLEILKVQTFCENRKKVDSVSLNREN